MGLQRLRIIGTDKPWLLKILEARISIVMVHTGLGRPAPADCSGGLLCIKGSGE